MKAIALPKYGSPDVLQVIEVEQPVPQANEVRIKVHAAAVTTADCALRTGKPLFARLFFGLTKPKATTPGTEFSGVIEAVGEEVTSFQPGDPIFAATGAEFGAHQEYLCLPANAALCLQPTNVNFAEAAALCEGSLTSLPFLRDHGQIKQGDQVLINGASGSVGTAAVQLAKHFGAQVTAVCSGKNIQLVESLGADEVVDYTQTDFTQSEHKFDIVFDAVGKSSYSACKKILKPSGIYLTTVIQFPILFRMLWGALTGRKKAFFAATGLRAPQDKRIDLEFIKDLVEAGALRATIEKTCTPDEIAAAHAHVDTGHKVGNVILILADEQNSAESV